MLYTVCFFKHYIWNKSNISLNFFGCILCALSNIKYKTNLKLAYAAYCALPSNIIKYISYIHFFYITCTYNIRFGFCCFTTRWPKRIFFVLPNASITHTLFFFIRTSKFCLRLAVLNFFYFWSWNVLNLFLFPRLNPATPQRRMSDWVQ